MQVLIYRREGDTPAMRLFVKILWRIIVITESTELESVLEGVIVGYKCCRCSQDAKVPMRSTCMHVCCLRCWSQVFEVYFYIL